MKQLGGLLIALALVGACDLTETRSLFQREGQLRLAQTDSITFTVPDTVAINTDFSISVLTYGAGCDFKGPTNLYKIQDSTAEFRPLDTFEMHGEICSNEVKTFTHTGTLRYGTAGATSVRVFGRDSDGSLMSRTRAVVIK